MHPDLIIVAAGNAKRMGNISVPKALYPICGVPNIVNTISKCESFVNRIYIVCGLGTCGMFSLALKDFPNVEFIEIKSGFGDGHAVLCALKSLNLNDCVILWGDAYLPNSNLISELCSNENKPYHHNPMFIPAIWEPNPYVSFNVAMCGKKIIAKSALFSKYGEYVIEGYHDQSMFRIHAPTIELMLDDMHNVLWKTDHYSSISKELNLLNAVHHMYNRNMNVEIFATKNQVFGFNSIDEVLAIENSCIL